MNIWFVIQSNMKCWEVMSEMELTYQCRSGKESWFGYISTMGESAPYEFEVEARGSSFHLLIGKHSYGNYLCIPNWGIGKEFSLLSDRFWNADRLKSEYPKLSKPDVISIVDALAVLEKYIQL